MVIPPIDGQSVRVVGSVDEPLCGFWIVEVQPEVDVYKSAKRLTWQHPVKNLFILGKACGRVREASHKVYSAHAS